MGRLASVSADAPHKPAPALVGPTAAPPPDARRLPPPGGEDSVMQRCTDGMLFGALAACGTCGGALALSRDGSAYRCGGDFSEFTKCEVRTQKPLRYIRYIRYTRYTRYIRYTGPHAEATAHAVDHPVAAPHQLLSLEVHAQGASGDAYGYKTVTRRVYDVYASGDADGSILPRTLPPASYSPLFPLTLRRKPPPQAHHPSPSSSICACSALPLPKDA